MPLMAEAELGVLFENANKAAALRVALIELGHPQPATPMQVDNSTVCGIVDKNTQQRKPKAIDMQLYWVQDHVHQGQYNV
eukprot:10993243-Ditylum_brightwellii.AAC.1